MKNDFLVNRKRPLPQAIPTRKRGAVPKQDLQEASDAFQKAQVEMFFDSRE